MKVIGITGPSGAGKSTLVEYLDLKTVNADSISRDVVRKGSDCLELLCKEFGNDILLDNNELNRKALAKKAFSTRENTDKLNSIVHPFVIKKMKAEIEFYRKSGEKAVILDAPQLFEAKLEKICDFTVGVIANKDTRIKRIMERDNITRQQALERIKAAKTDNFFKEKCDIVLENNEDLYLLRKDAEKIINLI